MKKTKLNPKGSAELIGAYSHGISVDLGASEMIFVTGQIAMNEKGEAIAPDDIEEQTRYVFKSIERILAAGNSSIKDVVKAVIYVRNIKDFAKISPIRNHYFAKSKPVSTLVEINATVKEGCDIEIEVIAIKKSEKNEV